MDALSVLRASRMFAGLSDRELEPLARAARWFEARPGQRLWLQGDHADALYVIGEGRTKTYRVGPDGQQIVLWFFGPGDTAGEPALFLPAATRGTAMETVERTAGVTIPRAALFDFLDHNPVVNRRILQRLSEMLSESPTMPSEVGYKEVSGRVAQKLLDLAAAHGTEVDGSTRIGLRLSQGTLANMVAASRENVNRALAPLLREGVVSHQGGYFTILDLARLLQRAAVGRTLPR